MLNSTVADPVAAVLDEASASSSPSCESCCRCTAALQLTWPDATFRLCRSCVPVELLPVELVPPPAAAAAEAAGACALQAAR